MPCIYDEGFAEARPCRIHIGGPMHIHTAVCPVCRLPLTAEKKNAFCLCPFTEPGWECMWNDDDERSVMTNTEIMEAEPWRGELHGPEFCCTCVTRVPFGGTDMVIHGVFGKPENGVSVLDRKAHSPHKLYDPTRLSGCYCDRLTMEDARNER